MIMTTTKHTKRNYEGIDTDDGLDKWREWVQRECAAELAAIVGDESAPASKAAPEVHVTPALTLAEFFRVAKQTSPGVRVEVMRDGQVQIDGTARGFDVTDACVDHYRKCVESLRVRAESAQKEADAIREVLAKAVTP